MDYFMKRNNVRKSPNWSTGGNFGSWISGFLSGFQKNWEKIFYHKFTQLALNICPFSLTRANKQESTINSLNLAVFNQQFVQMNQPNPQSVPSLETATILRSPNPIPERLALPIPARKIIRVALAVLAEIQVWACFFGWNYQSIYFLMPNQLQKGWERIGELEVR